jgi:hypothetical protein
MAGYDSVVHRGSPKNSMKEDSPRPRLSSYIPAENLSIHQNTFLESSHHKNSSGHSRPEEQANMNFQFENIEEKDGNLKEELYSPHHQTSIYHE